MSMMAAILDRVWRADRARQVVVATLALVVVFVIGFSLWGFDLIPGVERNGRADVHTGTMVLNTKDDTVCKQMKFDNESFRITTVRTVPCDTAAADVASPQSKASNGTHLDAIREGFRSR
jgi:hypothetical protein